MQINDRFMTVVTGAVLAIGGAAVSLFLEEETTDVAPQPVVVASLSVPSIPDANVLLSTKPVAEPVKADVPAMPVVPEMDQTAISGLERGLVFAAVEPAKRVEEAETGADLAEVAVLDDAPQIAMPLDFSDIVLTRTPAFMETPDLPQIATGLPEMTFDIADLIEIPATKELSCALDVRVTPIFGARVALKLNAPCHPDVTVTIKHAGLQFKERLTPEGTLELKIPAFEEYSRFDIELSDGTTSTVGAYIAGLSALERVGIAWNGANDTFLHALQNGAKIGDRDHVWRVAPSSFAKSRMNGGGYMMVLGDPTLENAQLAQVYTLPSRPRKRAQIVELQIETFRAETACGADMGLRVASHRKNSGAGQSALAVQLPACDASDSSLVLKSALKDMKVARK